MSTLRIIGNSLAALLAFHRRLWCRRLQHSPKAAKRVICILSLFASQKAIAFDPFSIAAGAQAVSSIFGAIRDSEEIVDAGFAVADLVDELEIDTETDLEIETQVRRLEEIARKSNQTRDEFGKLGYLLGPDLARSRNFAQRIRHVRSMIKTTKTLASIMGLKPKSGERALKVQDTKLQFMILEELMAIRRQQFETMLEKKEQFANYQIAIDQVLVEEGSRTRNGFGRIR